MTLLKNAWKWLKLPWRLFCIWRVVSEAKQSLPEIDEKEAVRNWCKKYNTYLIEWSSFTSTTIDDEIAAYVVRISSDKFDVLYDLLMKAFHGEDPSISQLSDVMTAMTEGTKVKSMTIVTILTLIVSIIQIIQTRRQNKKNNDTMNRPVRNFISRILGRN